MFLGQVPPKAPGLAGYGVFWESGVGFEDCSGTLIAFLDPGGFRNWGRIVVQEGGVRFRTVGFQRRVWSGNVQ